ncbi:HAD family hydrolase [Curtobacterium sp. RRHDQ10]|uniref:HAD family hydrolase n=1 Tax=Curtobacterium phyllosphaerae TaxID=3413379 RepID=UPI003BF11EB3
MSLFIPGHVVVFDYGEVISASPSAATRAALADATGVPLETLLPVYAEHRHDLDQGRVDVVGYWRRIAAACGKSWTITDIHRIWAIDFTGWFDVDPVVLDIVEELHDAGTRVAILSNAGHDFGDPYRHSPLGSLAELVVVSAEEDLLKPDPAIYRRTCERLGIDARQMVFVDNRAENARGASDVGAIGHHFTSAAGLRTFLTDLQETTA